MQTSINSMMMDQNGNFFYLFFFAFKNFVFFVWILTLFLFYCSWNYFVKHWPVASQPLGLFVICIAIWAICRILLFEYTTLDAVPMRMAILFIGAQICGILLRLFKLPEMLGMLGFGVFFTNMEYANFEGYNELESILR